jgi:HEAT repeat protein
VEDKESDVRLSAAYNLGIYLSYVPDKKRAWEKLHELTENEDWYVRSGVAESIGSAYFYIEDKQQAWEDLVKLSKDKSIDVSWNAASAIGSVFSQVPNKKKAWDDLHKLLFEKCIEVNHLVVFKIGHAFPQIPEKQEAWEDLIKLSTSNDLDIRRSANYSLGEISVFKASESESDEEYIKKLEAVIEFFEKASNESSEKFDNPSDFCLPLYRSFYTIITTEKQQAKDEVDKYLAEAKNAIGKSENKKLLFEIVENLANALKEVQDLENIDLEAKKSRLNFYQKHCDKALKLFRHTEKKSPYATVVMRKGLPFLDRRLKSLLDEIQEKAKTACQESKGTDTEEIACAVSREVQNWEIGGQEEMTQKVEDVAYILKKKVVDLPENEYVLNKIETMRHEKDLMKQYETLIFVISQIPTVKVVHADVVVENINRIGQDLGTKLDNISQEMNEIRISLKPGIKEEFEISSGIEIWGTGAKHIVTIPLQEISYDELKGDLKRIKGKHITKLSKLPDRLSRKIKGYLLLNDREDILEQLN